MSRDVSLTPLGYVQESFWRYTDRNPADEQAVFDMVEAATIDTFGADKAAVFTATLAKSLDPATSRFGVTNALKLEELGERIKDTSAPVVVKWGSLALLGALHSVYDDRVNHGDYDPSTRHEQVASHVARGVLLRVVNDAGCGGSQRELAKGFLGDLPTLPSEDLGVEISLYKRPETFTADSPHLSAPAQETIVREPLTPVGQVGFAEIDPNISNILNKLPWLDATLEAAPLFEISDNDKSVALLYDLTGFHRTLKNYKEDVENDVTVSKIFSNKLPTGLIQHTLNNGTTTHKTSRGYVPTYYLTNRGSRNEHTLRVYYVQLGSTADNRPVFGMVAACRTKKREHTVLRIITPTADNKKDSER